ncbi:hypothetical protein D3C73_1263850 [compost metagenome]
MLVLVRLKQPCAKQRSLVQFERTHKTISSRIRCKIILVQFFKSERHFLLGSLNGSLRGPMERGAQTLMPLNNMAERLLQSAFIEYAFYLQRAWHIVTRPGRIQLMQNQQPLLSR